MARKSVSGKRLPAHYPSVPDSEAKPGTHDEPAVPSGSDMVPAIKWQPAKAGSLADLRIRIEQLLRRRDAVRPEDWAALGEAGHTLLVEMLDDEVIRSHDALFHRLIAILGQLGVERGVAPLGAILKTKSESNLTKAYVATALGHIGGPGVLEMLAASVADKDDMVRRQVAKSLVRLDQAAAVPHLLKLRSDKSAAVSEVATAGLQRWDKKRDAGVRTSGKKAERKPRTRKLRPAIER
jgi:HEAT repeat protein